MATQEDQTEASISQEAYPCIEILSGPTLSSVGRHALRSGKNYIGRLSENDIVLDDTSVSRRHVMIEIKGNEATVADQGSRNGTKMGGQTLTPDESYPLAHNTQFRVGSYRIRFLVRPETAAVEEEPPPPDIGTPEREPERPLREEVGVEEEVQKVRRLKGLRQFVRPALFGVLAIVIVVAGFQAYHFLKPKKSKSGRKHPRPAREELLQKGTGEVLPPSEEPQKSTAARPRPVFLEFSSDPIPAKVFFGPEEIGETPVRVSTKLEEGKKYEIRAVYNLSELGHVIEEKTGVQLTPGTEVIPVVFRPKVGVFKVSTLPRNSQLYLEGYFETDPYRAKPIKFAEIVFGKPVYVPFGRYTMEFRESRQMEGSQTFVDQVIYRREFALKPDQSSYTVEVREEELKLFPAQISSSPTASQVFIDDKETGVTPYTGTFPLGEHRLLLRKEGFFDYSQLMKMEINTPFVAEISLKTSQAGEMINRATDLIRNNGHVEAQALLIEAYKNNPSPRESAEISYLIGVCYLWQKSYPEAEEYFNRAMEHPDLKLHGRLGLASAAHHRADSIRALQLLIDLLVSAEDPALRSDAGTLFQRVSPLKSVIYVTSDPVGAIVFVNGKEIPQVSPLVLHDLSVGSYRIEVKMGGYQPTEVKVGLGVAEFRPVVVKLQPVE
ncbi:MAG: PEGA domain-containing protein [Deltaproteobacteria bacterium]|nr:PEGA domain-containing protein [Deltaproteobacteria bacterium]